MFFFKIVLWIKIFQDTNLYQDDKKTISISPRFSSTIRKFVTFHIKTINVSLIVFHIFLKFFEQGGRAAIIPYWFSLNPNSMEGELKNIITYYVLFLQLDQLSFFVFSSSSPKTTVPNSKWLISLTSSSVVKSSKYYSRDLVIINILVRTTFFGLFIKRWVIPQRRWTHN